MPRRTTTDGSPVQLRRAAATKNDPDEVGKVRVCPECGGEWKELR